MASGLLVRHFLRRFIDNDLISPDADRHEVLAVTAAALSMSGLFLTVLLSIAYLFRPLQSRGWTALASLHDTFVWCGFTMAIMGLVALAAWDGFTLDARDTSILSVLPVRRGRIAGAQLVAVLLFGMGFVVCATVVPTLLAPLIRVSRLPIGAMGIARLIGAHAAATMSAGLFGFVSMIAIRETLRAVLVRGWFDRVAPVAQGVLVAVLATCLLLLPAFAAEIDRRWLSGAATTTPPPMWFVGLHERLAGDALVGLPATEPPADAPAAVEIRRGEARMLGRYESRRPTLDALAGRAVAGLGSVIVIAALAWAWNSRRWPQLARGRTGRQDGLLGGPLLALERRVARRPVERAGFAFARQTIGRSATHRVRLAAALGSAVACAAFCMRGVSIEPFTNVKDLPLAALATQTLVLTIISAGYRHATRVPAGLGASDTFAITGFDGARPFLDGVKRAGIVLVGCPVLGLLWPLHASFLGWHVASLHLVCGLLILLALMEVAFFRADDVPLVSSQAPTGHGPALASVYGLLALSMAWVVAGAERLAFNSPEGTVALAGVLLAGWLVLRIVNRHGSSVHPTLSFNHQVDAAQRLGLSE